MKKRSDYEIIKIEEDRIFIVDLDLGNISVTNDAEKVYFEITKHFPGKRLIYKDTIENWDEIIMENFCAIFKNYKEHTPEIKEIKKFPDSELLRKI